MAEVQTRARRNTLDEMTIRRTEVPAAKRPRKPTLDEMGPARDGGIPVPKPAPKKPRLPRHKPGSPVGKGKRG